MFLQILSVFLQEKSILWLASVPKDNAANPDE